MPIYQYRAKKGPQEIIDGSIEAQSEKEAIEKLSLLGYLPLRIEEGGRIPEDKMQAVSGGRAGRIRPREITIFSRQLASLLKSGVPILASLNIIAEQSENQNLKHIVRSIFTSVKEGATFSSSLQQYPRVFSRLYIAMVRTGENSGVLPDVLLRISDYRSKQEEALSRLRMALAYPILMALVGAGTIIFMLTYVLPRLMKIFVTLGQQLPLPTRIVIRASETLRIWWIWALLALFIIVGRRQARSAVGRALLSRITLRLPVLGIFILKTELGRFCRTLEVLLKSGIPILKALDVTIPVVGNEVIREKLKASHAQLEQGGSFGKGLKSSKVFPLFMTNLLIVGEESGKLTDALSEIASSYERDTEEAAKVMTNLLEPMMILLMGLVVGFIVVAMLLPIFEINVMAR